MTGDVKHVAMLPPPHVGFAFLFEAAATVKQAAAVTSWVEEAVEALQAAALCMAQQPVHVQGSQSTWNVLGPVTSWLADVGFKRKGEVLTCGQ